MPWYRLLYVYPSGLVERLVELIAREPRIVPYIDIPIQHASDKVLRRMRRPERQDTIRQKVFLLRTAVPDIAIRTTAVLGFPGETDEDFRVLCDFVEELEFERETTEFFYTRQRRQLGLGHAVLCARHLLEKQPFAQ